MAYDVRVSSRLLRPNVAAGFIEAAAEGIDRMLREGDILMWPGDPDLSLNMGYVQMEKRAWVPQLGRYANKGEVITRRYEVWRHCEDGVDRIIGTWNPDHIDRIIPDLARMRLGSPGHVDTIKAIDDHNDALREANSRETREVMAEVKEYATKLVVEREEGKSFFPVGDKVDLTPKTPAGE